MNFKIRFGFDRAISVSSDIQQLPESQVVILEQVKDFGIDEVYFCTDDKQSYPAVFLKRVESFDTITLKEIANIHLNTWNYKKVLFLYVYSDIEIRIYNCVEKPIVTAKAIDYNKELGSVEIAKASFISDNQKLEELNKLFSSIAIDTGIIWTLEEANDYRKKINLQRRVDKYLVESLIRTTKQLEAEGLKDVEAIHRIMMRSLFLLYLEDRGATDAKFYESIKSGAISYFDILDDVDSTFRLFSELERHFNGNVFYVEEGEQNEVKQEHLNLIKRCFINGYDGLNQQSLFDDWRLFNFKIIQIELLSEIYETFLALTGPQKKLQTGTFYTPPSLVELILNEKLPTNKSNTNYNVKVLDPACGSGIFLVESFKRLIKRYENKTGEKLTDFEILKDLLVQNIYGIEYSAQSIVVAAFSLYLALLDNLNPKTLWQDRQLPYLINDPKNIPAKKQGKNLYCRDTIEINSEIESIEFDLVVGNPPFGTENKSKGVVLLESIRNYCDDNGFAKEMVLPFLHKAVKFAPNGEVIMIFNTKILTNTGSTYQNFRKWLMQECYVEKIYNFSILRNAPKDLGGQLFGSAMGPICIVFYQKKAPVQQSDRIVYYAPKTFIKSNVFDGVVIDSIDVKYLPREECQKPDTKIWKISMWGGERDFKLINKLLSSDYSSVETYVQKYNIKSGVGFQLLTQKKDLVKTSDTLAELLYLDADAITRYFSSKQQFVEIKKAIKRDKAISFYKEHYNVESVSNIDKVSVFRRLGDMKAYVSPHFVVKKGLENNKVCASFIEDNCSFRDGVYGFYGDDQDALKVLMAYLNSKLSTYFLFMTISSYGVEREQIMKNEYLSVPIKNYHSLIEGILPFVNNIIRTKRETDLFCSLNIDDDIEQIESIINSALDLDEKDCYVIKNAIEMNIDLFHSREKSKALYPILSTKDYAEILCSDLNDFLNEQRLFANGIIYSVNKFSPLAMIKISFSNSKREIETSIENIDVELKKIEKRLWEEKAENIYFRRKLSYYDGDDIYIIRPNQGRFWTETMAMEDASELILEILNAD